MIGQQYQLQDYLQIGIAIVNPPPEPEEPFPQFNIPLHYLYQYIATIFYPLSAMPAPQELFEDIKIIDNQEIEVNLRECRMDQFKKKYNDELQSQNYIFYLYSGKVYLSKSQEENFHNPETENLCLKQSKRRKSSIFVSSQKSEEAAIPFVENNSSSLAKDKNIIEVKENSFFSLINYRRPTEPEKYSLIGIETSQSTKNKCLFGVFKINPKYCRNWYVSESQKYLFLSKIFWKGKDEISQTKIKGICRFFKRQRYRRGTLLVRQNEENQNLLILCEGQCQYTKSFLSPMTTSQNQHLIRLANAGPQSIFGTQFLLYQFSGFSKSVTVVTRSLMDQYGIEQVVQKKEKSDKKQSDDKDLNQGKSPSKKQKGQVTDKTERKNKRQPQEIKFILNRASFNNFNVVTTSAYADFYQIPMHKLKDLCAKYVQELPFILRSLVENNYVTLLRNLKEKIDRQKIKINRNISKNKEDRILFQARVQSGQYGSTKEVLIGREGKEITKNFESIIEEESPSKIKINRSQLVNINMKNPITDISRNRRLQKKIQIALQDKKQPGNFKQKIEVLLKQKLSSLYEAESPEKNEDSSAKHADQGFSPTKLANFRYSPEVGQAKKQQILTDLQQIFMNSDNNSRSQSINRHFNIISKKQNLLKKRYGSIDNNLIIDEECYDINKNKMYRMDLLRKGLKMEDINKKTNEDYHKHQKKRSLDIQEFSSNIKKKYTEKINKANKIKEQFMTIRSQCQVCHCYDEIDHLYNSTGFSGKDLKSQTMKTGSVWRLSETDKKEKKDEPLQKLHSKTKFISQKTVKKYQHNEHIKNKRKGLISSLNNRRLSAPLLVTNNN